MDKLYIIKIGGNVIDDEEKLLAFLGDFSSIPEKKILVHGGGKLATQLASRLQVPQRMIEGRRVTDRETLQVITMVYAGLINKNIVARLQANDCNAIGLCGADGDTILSHKREHPLIDYGYVGDVDHVNDRLIATLLSSNLVPVFAPITHDHTGQLLNTNADTIAQVLAKGLSHAFETILVYLFEKKGVLRDEQDENSLVRVLDKTSYAQLRKEERIFAGMIPKIDNAFTALQSGVSRVLIGKADELHAILGGHSGTQILHE
jgi:acetylglutamate kinase